MAIGIPPHIKQRDAAQLDYVSAAFCESGYRVALVGSAARREDYGDIDLLIEQAGDGRGCAPFDNVLREVLAQRGGRVYEYGRDRAMDYAGTVIAHRCKLRFSEGVPFDLCFVGPSVPQREMSLPVRYY